ncbi:hypothetical protein [Enterococcus mundtii]|uniref:hypothetical protein n=1 Tax=Enterococcus mundtii TaxID=53346 RepID=UPI001A96F6DE|nr:hypothetical protein [Enterococcus mundtii]MBO1087204.1 hypothetical protein [Enterococcus mundtii]
MFRNLIDKIFLTENAKQSIKREVLLSQMRQEKLVSHSKNKLQKHRFGAKQIQNRCFAKDQYHDQVLEQLKIRLVNEIVSELDDSQFSIEETIDQQGNNVYKAELILYSEDKNERPTFL